MHKVSAICFDYFEFGVIEFTQSFKMLPKKSRGLLKTTKKPEAFKKSLVNKFRDKKNKVKQRKKNKVKLGREDAIKKQINDEVPGGRLKKIPVKREKLEKYSRGEKASVGSVVGKIEKEKLRSKEKKVQFSVEQSARNELLLTEEGGFLEADESENEITAQFSQTDIQNSVDSLSATKRFDLQLNSFGPYRLNYSRNGRFLLLGGRKGHVSAMDWMSKKLLCEINVMDSAYDVAWLHQESFFAVAQKKWVYIYDSQGVEIHCLKQLFEVYKLTYLPYHFLLATVVSIKPS